ncbi:MAG: oxidative damage protection protein [Pseudomonadota bacterium]|nr:oxidative damage protection protein [Pseudomonadota bacterium]
MPDQIFCKKLKKNGLKIENPPLPGTLGVKIQQNICQEAWDEWLELQTKIINENRLLPINTEHRDILKKEMLKFLGLD